VDELETTTQSENSHRPTTFTDDLRQGLEKILAVRGVTGGGTSIFGREAKTSTTRCIPAGGQSISLTSPFRCHWRKTFLFIHLMADGGFPFNNNEPFARIAWHENPSFTLDPIPVNG
jgi:hypothetical protein